MASVINALTSGGGVAISGDTSGNLAIQSNGTTIATATSSGFSIPKGVSGIPVFRAYANAGTSVTTSTFTTIAYAVVDFDTNSFYSTSTNRFTPTIAGYYQINASVSIAYGAVSNNNPIGIFKNNAWYTSGPGYYGSSGGYGYACISDVIYFNGSGDYIDIRYYQNTGGSVTTQGAAHNAFSGILVRSA